MFPTGYANQAKLLADYLHRQGHEVHYFANGYTGSTLKKAILTDGTEFNYTIHGQGQQPYFADKMTPLIKELNIDAFIILLDTFMLHGDPKNPANGWFLKIDTTPATTFFWFPSDGGAGLPHGCETILRKIDNPVAMAEYGQKQVKDYYDLQAHFIPHGTEPNRFKKLPDEERAQIRAKWGIPQDAFVVGTIARNQGRKMLDRTLKTIKEVGDRIPNLLLFLHLDINDPAQAFNMVNVIQRYNLENKVRTSGMSALKGFDWEQMNELYNLFDVFLLTTSGEGFGVPIIEAMSAEIPVLATDYTTTPELVFNNQSGLGILPVGLTKQLNLYGQHTKEYDNALVNSTITGSWDVERGLCDVVDAANKLVYLAQNPEQRKVFGKNGRDAVLKKYDFENVVGPMWNEAILKATNGS